MSLITTTPPGDPGTALVATPADESHLPGPLLFVTRAFRTLWTNGKARIGIVLLVLFILMAVLAPLIAPHSPSSTDFTPYQNPSSTNWFGTTGNGQDVISQVVY
jgi:peptide/nickel transport system permease protein